MKTCDQCDAGVTEQYWRVFSVDGTLHGCPNCESKTSDHRPTEGNAQPQSA